MYWFFIDAWSSEKYILFKKKYLCDYNMQVGPSLTRKEKLLKKLSAYRFIFTVREGKHLSKRHSCLSTFNWSMIWILAVLLQPSMDARDKRLKSVRQKEISYIINKIIMEYKSRFRWNHFILLLLFSGPI